MHPQPTKCCTLCNTDKPLSEFHRDKSRRDGHRDRCKACILGYNRSWYETNKREIIDKQMAAYQANRETKIAYTHEWYRRTKPERLAKMAAYRAAHLEEIRAAQRASAPQHVISNREWRRKNPERSKIHKQRGEMIRRARKRNTQIEPVNTDAIITRDKSLCGICNRVVEPKDRSFDHSIPLSRGGAHAEWNLQLAHWACNVKRQAGRTPGQPRLPL